MKLKTLATTALLAFAFVTSTIAQNAGENPPEEELGKGTAKAYDYYEAKEYVKAIDLLKDAFSDANSRKEKAEITFRLAESYRAIGDCKSASLQYRRAAKMNYDAIAQLRYADMLRCLGEYEDAIVEYEVFKEEKPNDPRGEEGIAACKQSIAWMKEPSRYTVNNMKDFNSKSRDFGVSYAGKRADDYSVLFISSMREESEGKREDGWTGENYSDIYKTEAERKSRRGKGRSKSDDNEEQNWSALVPLDETINTKEHEGSVAFDSRMKTMYFTKCVNVKNMKMGCAIYESRRMGQNWGAPELVVLAPDSTYSVGHPSLSVDDKFLYFAGNLPGTKGGNDIWVATYDRREKKWTPKNLGPKVNTDGDEVFPFAHDDGYLYFSSNGLPGMGELDIFRVKIDENGMPIEDPENMKHPINTNANDFGIIWEMGATKKGYMISDRKGGRGSDDIYGVYLVPLKFQMNGLVTSSKDGTPVPQATVRLDGTDGTSVVVNSNADGQFVFETDMLKEDVQYKINVEKKKFLNNSADFTTIGVDLSGFEYVPSENIFLHSMSIEVKVDPIEVPIVLPDVFFDLAKWDLRPESMKALDSVVAILNNNPNITIIMRSHTDYRDTDAKNKALSKKRADTCVSYLISKGIAADRLSAEGMGESEPFVIPENYKGFGAGEFEAGTRLTEGFIKQQSSAKQEIANQLNRRTDFKVDRDDYVPAKGTGTAEETTEEPKEKGKPKGEFYTCKARDSFGRIARQYKLNVVELKALNGGLRGVRVFEGLMLKVTKDGDYTQWDANHYQVQFRDTLDKIEQETGVDKKELRNLNDGVKDKDLKPGMWLKIN